MPELGPLDGAVRTLEQCIDRGLTRSAQVAVRHRGEWIANGAVGTTGSGGGPPSQDTAYVWSCATKPLAAIIIGTLIDEGALDVDEPLGRFLPELPVHLSRITLSELLTHTAPLSDVGAGNFCIGRNVDYARGNPEAALAAIVDAPMEADVAAGKVASYSVFANWFLLSEVIERVLDVPFDTVCRKRIIEPLDIDMCLSLSRERVIALDRAPCAMPFHDVRTRFFQRGPQDDDPEGALEILDGSSPHVYMPGGSGVGPVSSLVTVLDAVMSDAADDGQHLLTSATARRLVSPHRVGLRDNVLANDLSWGLGFTVDSRAFCPRLSQRTFGHLGWHGCCIAFADPASGLAVGVAFDRLVDARSALLRHAAVVGAIVRDVQDAALV